MLEAIYQFLTRKLFHTRLRWWKARLNRISGGYVSPDSKAKFINDKFIDWILCFPRCVISNFWLEQLCFFGVKVWECSRHSTGKGLCMYLYYYRYWRWAEDPILIVYAIFIFDKMNEPLFGYFISEKQNF